MRVDNNLFGQAPRQIANIPRPKVVREADALAGVHFAIFAFYAAKRKLAANREPRIMV